MLRSMTGYGRHVIHSKTTTVTVEIRAVNHRFLDFSIKIPSNILFLEEKIRKVMKSVFSRGRIEVFVKIEGAYFTEKKLKCDFDLMDQYIDNYKKVKKRYNLSGEIPTTIITSVPELFSVQEVENEPAEWNETILECILIASKKVIVEREREGAYLLEDISKRVKNIEEIVTLIKSRKNDVLLEYKQKIQLRVQDHLKNAILLDETRLIPEIALMAEKGDITEEVIRLKSHIEHFYNIIKKTETQVEPIGRTIDFIVQEMQRETNTIGAKSLDVKTSEWVVLLKGENEKIREQTQNIE